MSSPKTFIIAEAGVNHNGRLDEAKALVDAAKFTGADAIKFQTFFVEEGYSHIHAKKEKIDWAKSLELKVEAFVALHEYCIKQDIIFMSTPFDIPSVEVLAKMNIPAYKVASTELGDAPLLKHIAGKGRPIILSTGMAKRNEIVKALETIRSNWKNSPQSTGNDILSSKVYLLYCVSMYPAPYNKNDLNKMVRMKKTFKIPVGFSDHSLGWELPIAAVSLGAKIIEKHIKLAADHDCPDAQVSLAPDEFMSMVKSIRNVEAALGSGSFELSEEERVARKKLQKGLIALRDMKAGERITENDIVLKRPAGELGLEQYHGLIGSVLQKDVQAGDYFTRKHYLDCRKRKERLIND